MKNFKTTFLIITIILSCLHHVIATDYKAGDDVVISNPVDGDLYVAGDNVRIKALIDGDLIAAGGELWVENSISQDVLIAGGKVVISGDVGDDIRAAGGELTVNSKIKGDLIIFGGKVDIGPDALIEGDLHIFGGEVLLKGTVLGDARSYGGTIDIEGIVEGELDLKSEEATINGSILGSATMAAGALIIKDNAMFGQGVRYWTEDGQFDFGNSLSGGSAIYDDELEIDQLSSWGFGKSLGLLFLYYVLSVLLVLALIHLLFRKKLYQLGESISSEPGKSVVYGLIYFLGLPIVGFLLLFTIIGVPVGVFILNIYAFSLIFGLSVASVVLTWYIKVNYDYNQWNTFSLILVSAGIFTALRIITMIPFIGWIVYLIVVSMAFGTIIYSIAPRSKVVSPYRD